MKWKKNDLRVKSAQKYSYIIKILQLTAIVVALGFFLFKSCFCHAHVDLHFHSIEWDAEQEMREAREVLVEEWHLQNPGVSEETSKEVDERIRQGFDFPA